MKVIEKFAIIILMTTIFFIILGTNVQATTVQEKQTYSLASEIQIRILPLMNSAKIGPISGEVQVTEVINDWCKVENNEQQGWIRVNNIKGVGSTEAEEVTTEPIEEEQTEIEDNKIQEEPKEEPKDEKKENVEEKVEEMSKTGYVDADGLVIRKEPNTSSEALHSLSRNAKVKITGKVGNWYRIDYDGEVAYVSAKYVSDKKNVETTSRGETSREEEKVNNQPKEEPKEEIKEEVKEEPKKEEISNLGQQVVDYAKKYLGYKYVSGGASPSTGFDCSGFTQYVYKNFGITLSRTSSGQNSNGVAVNKSNLQLGDLVIFKGESNKSIGHVGIYVGDGNFIHASNPSEGVKITSLSLSYYATRYVGARRVI